MDGGFSRSMLNFRALLASVSPEVSGFPGLCGRGTCPWVGREMSAGRLRHRGLGLRKQAMQTQLVGGIPTPLKNMKVS